jgi:hypothetical protein
MAAVSEPRLPLDTRLRTVVAGIAVGLLVVGCAAVVAEAVVAARGGSLDPTRGARMGSTALDFRVGVAYVIMPAAITTGAAFIFGRRVIELQLVAMAAIVASSTALFYLSDIDGCYPGTGNRPTGVFGLAVLALVTLAGFCSAILNRRRGATPYDQAWLSICLVAVVAVIAYVQMWHCATSQQIGREFIAPMTAAMLVGPLIAIGSVAGWLIGTRSHN